MAAGGEVVVQEARSVHDDSMFVLSTRPEKGFMDKDASCLGTMCFSTTLTMLFKDLLRQKVCFGCFSMVALKYKSHQQITLKVTMTIKKTQLK